MCNSIKRNGAGVEIMKLRLSPCLKVPPEAALQHAAQHPSGPDKLQGAVLVPLQVPAHDPPQNKLDLGCKTDRCWGSNDLISEVLVTCRRFCVSRDDEVDLVGSYQFDDQLTEGEDVFSRDPYILRFRCRNTGEVFHLQRFCADASDICFLLSVSKPQC